MSIKIIGVCLILLACGGFGFSAAASYLREVRTLQSLITAVSYMKCELQYQCIALPDLCEHTAGVTNGVVRKFFYALAKELESQVCPNAVECVAAALNKCSEMPGNTKDLVNRLGKTLGIFGVDGQIEGLRKFNAECDEKLKILTQRQNERIRSYQTIGICAGAALAILLV